MFLCYCGCLVQGLRFLITVVAWYVYVSLLLWLPGARSTFPYDSGCLVCLCFFITALNFLEPRLRFLVTVVAWLATFLVYTSCLVPLPRFSIIMVAWYVYVSLLLWLPGARSTFPYDSGCFVCLISLSPWSPGTTPKFLYCSGCLVPRLHFFITVVAWYHVYFF